MSGRLIAAYLRQAEPAPVADGNLFHPVPVGTGIRGGWRQENRTLLWVAPGLTGIAGIALVPTVVNLSRRRG